jgi:hypothetical protein
MGSGGIDRGRGDAPMVWGDTSDRSGTETQKRILPSGFRDPHNQALIGVGLSLPQVKYVEDIRSGTDIPVSPTEGDRSWKRDISPAHRKIVRDYFKE